MNPKDMELARLAIEVDCGGSWKKPGKGELRNDTKVGKIDCPVCGGKLTLRYRRAGVNGHIQARCQTKGCVSWLE